MLSKDDGLSDTGHSMNIGNLILGINRVAVSYLVHYDSLLQSATDIITKYDSYFITKSVRFFNYKMRQLYYKMRQLLQNATYITNCDSARYHLSLSCLPLSLYTPKNLMRDFPFIDFSASRNSFSLQKR